LKQIEANPTLYRKRTIEFFFKTARMLGNLAVTQTIFNFTSINYILPHVGGAFPSVADRLLRSFSALCAPSMTALQTRFYWIRLALLTSIKLLGCLRTACRPRNCFSGLIFPTRPYSRTRHRFSGSRLPPFVTDAERPGIFTTNPQQLLSSRLP
jgi:hypothetical protein